MTTESQLHTMRTPLVAPFGLPVDRAAVQEVWDVFVKPTQSDDAAPQSVRGRNGEYRGLPDTARDALTSSGAFVLNEIVLVSQVGTKAYVGWQARPWRCEESR